MYFGCGFFFLFLPSGASRYNSARNGRTKRSRSLKIQEGTYFRSFCEISPFNTVLDLFCHNIITHTSGHWDLRNCGFDFQKNRSEAHETCETVAEPQSHGISKTGKQIVVIFTKIWHLKGYFGTFDVFWTVGMFFYCFSNNF